MKDPGGVSLSWRVTGQGCYHLTLLHALGRHCLFEKKIIKVEAQL